MTRLRVLLGIADAGLSRRVSAALRLDRCEIVASCSTAAEIGAAAARRRPEACVLDADLPGGALEATAQIMRVLPDPAVVMLGPMDDHQAILAALRGGAVGFLPRSMDLVRLGAALRGAVAGEAALPRTIIPMLLAEFRDEGSHRRPVPDERERKPLTARERDVLAELRRGAHTREIASVLGISEVTVRRHVSGVLEKFGAPDRSGLLAMLDGGS